MHVNALCILIRDVPASTLVDSTSTFKVGDSYLEVSGGVFWLKLKYL